MDHSFADLVQPGHIGNNFVTALTIALSLSMGCKLIVLGINAVSGFKLIDVMANPMLRSSSPSDFWGRRWNRLVHVALKGGVYRPMRKNNYPVWAASMATFAASGIIHEWILSIIFYVHGYEKVGEGGVCHGCPRPIYGKQTMFFLWNGVLIVLERLLGHFPIFRWMGKNIPKPLVTLMVVLCALPVGHWFCGDLVRHDYFLHYALGYPLILKMENL